MRDGTGNKIKYTKTKESVETGNKTKYPNETGNKAEINQGMQ